MSHLQDKNIKNWIFFQIFWPKLLKIDQAKKNLSQKRYYFGSFQQIKGENDKCFFFWLGKKIKLAFFFGFFFTIVLVIYRFSICQF